MVQSTRMGRITWALVGICVLVQLIGPHGAAAQGDDRLVWRSLETEHFRVHYHEPLGLLARHVVAEAEQIHARVTGGLGLSIRQRVELVLSDSDDAANGLAGPLPYNAIRLRAVAPDDLSALADYDDWPTLLLTHEHAHIVHLEHATGLPLLVQRIFGRVYTPQQFLPGWLVEGLAVVEETEHTTGGRGRGSMFDMFLRMDALADRVLPLDWIGFDGEPWPHGNVRYLYGQAFMGFITKKYGERALGRFVEEYGKRLVPYGIGRAMQRATGETIETLYARFAQDLREHARTTRDAVLLRGEIDGVQLTRHGELTRTPRFVSNDELVYSVSDERSVPELRRIRLDQPSQHERIVRTVSVAQSARVPGTSEVVFSVPDFHRSSYFFNDLFRVDTRGGRRRRLTHGLRGREPDVSPDGKSVAYVVTGAGTSHLELAALSDIEHTRRMLVQSQRLEQVFTPRFSPDGKRIAYSAWSRGGFRDLWIVDVASGERLRITNDRALDRGPAWAPDGNTLYFASDRTGISNLYAYRLDTNELTQITNVLGGAFQPDVSPDGKVLVYVGYSSKGFDLFRLDIDPSRSLPALPSFVRPNAEPLPQAAAVASEPYQPMYSLWPRSWQIAQDEDLDGARLTATTSGSDAVGFHGYSLSTSVSLVTGNVGTGVSYAYRKPRFPVLLSGSVRQQDRQDLVVTGRSRTWQALAWSGSVGTRLSFPRGLHGFALRPDYAFSYLEKREPYAVPLDPNAAPPRLPRLGPDARLSLTISYSNSQRQAYDVSRSWGQSLTLRPSVRNQVFGSRLNDVGLSFRAEQFVRFDFRESVLALAYTGALKTPVAIGGFPAQATPLFDYLIGTEPSPADVARLRGFEARRGDQLHVVQVEYRLLLTRINRGYATLPLFARRVHLALFSDIGNAYVGSIDVGSTAVGTGAELRFDWANAYSADYTLRFGIAQGLTAGGKLQAYMSIARPF